MSNAPSSLSLAQYSPFSWHSRDDEYDEYALALS
jgi:hypothetical protein